MSGKRGVERNDVNEIQLHHFNNSTFNNCAVGKYNKLYMFIKSSELHNKLLINIYLIVN